jgi:hypothetical protein
MIVLCLLASLPGCRLLRKRKSEAGREAERAAATTEKTIDQDLLLEGEVRFFDQQYDCVVIEYKRGPIPPSGTPLVVLRNERIIGRLRASDLAGGRKAIADVIEGQVAAGDTVRWLPQKP